MQPGPKILIIIGIILILVGIFWHFSLIGKLPGDIVIKKDRFSFYFPIGTSIILSLLISFLFYILNKLF